MNLSRGAGYAEGATEKTNETTNTPFSLEITEQKKRNKRRPEYWPLTQVKGMVCDIGIKSKRKKKGTCEKKWPS